MSKKYYLLIYALLIVLVVASLAFILKSLGVNLIKSNTINTQNAYVHARIINLSSEINAALAAIHVKDFQPVKKGDLLFSLNCQDYEQAAFKAQTELDKAKENVKKLELTLELNEEACKVSEFDIQAASAKAQNAKDEYVRINNMFKSQAVSVKNMQAAKAAYTSAEANLASMKIKAKQCLLKSKLAQSDVQLARLNVQSSQSALNLAGANLSRCNIYAPEDAHLSAINVGVGDYLSPSKLITKLIANKRWVVANIKESDLEGLKIGDKAEFTADASSKIYHGKVEQISAASGNELAVVKMDNSVGNFIKITQRIPVVISIDEDASQLASGQSLKLKIYKQ